MVDVALGLPDIIVLQFCDCEGWVVWAQRMRIVGVEHEGKSVNVCTKEKLTLAWKQVRPPQKSESAADFLLQRSRVAKRSSTSVAAEVLTQIKLT